MSSWTFFSNHAHVLLLICDEPDLRMRDIAARVDITERAVQRIVHGLVVEGYLQVEKEGRRNHYTPDLDAHLRHPLEAGVTIRQLLEGVRPDHAEPRDTETPSLREAG
jgi:DNA-binding transcriptional regulator LsrR (DeoR family)